MLLVLTACSEKHADGGRADASMPSDASANVAECRREGDACGPAGPCCPATLHVIGMRVDLARKCYAQEKEILFCRTRDDAGGCGASEGHDCWLRRSDDGGSDVFFTPNTWRPGDLPGFEHCDADLAAEVTMQMNVCP